MWAKDGTFEKFRKTSSAKEEVEEEDAKMDESCEDE